METLYFAIALLFISYGAPANADFGEDGDPGEVYFDYNRNITLNCTIPSPDKTQSYVWKKNDVGVEQIAELKGRYKMLEEGAVFSLSRSVEDDYGNYSCALGAEERAWEVRGRPVARLPDNTNVVEGQKIKLQCKVTGKPYPAVSWYYNSSATANESQPLKEGSRDGRVKLESNEQGISGGALVLESAARGDAGLYACRAGASSDHTQLRVKDMYAALWPFLGICAEVFVLCAIILVYEKRRTKPELDDSDTDNHDQKKS